MVFYAAFNSISVISQRQLTLFMLSWVSPVLGWALKCLAQGHFPRKNPEDPVRLEPRTPGLQVKHFTTEPRKNLIFFRIKASVNIFNITKKPKIPPTKSILDLKDCHQKSMLCYLPSKRLETNDEDKENNKVKSPIELVTPFKSNL